MAPTLSLTPNPAPFQSGLVDYYGAGYPKGKLRVQVDGTTIATVRADSRGNIGSAQGGQGISLVGAPWGASYRITVVNSASIVLAAQDLVVRQPVTPPPPPPPPPPAATVCSSTIAAGATIAGKLAWEIRVTSGPAPSRIDFYVDGSLRWTESAAPYWYNGDPSGVLDTTLLSEGPHALTALAYDAAGKPTAQGPIGGGVTVHNATTPPPPPPISGPFPGFAKADAAVPPGGTVDVPASVGVTGERFSLVTPGVRWRLATGVVLDWAGQAIPIQAGAFRLAGADIVFEGGEGRRSSGAEYVIDGDRCTILNHRSHDHVQETYVIHGQDARITGGSITDCDLSGIVYDQSEQGAGKATRRGLRISGVYLARIGKIGGDQRAGQGFWWDSIRGTANLAPPGPSQGWEGELDHCVIEDVFYGAGFFEIGVGWRAHHNAIIRCGQTPSGAGFWGAGLIAAGSSDVDAYSNVTVDCQSCFRLVLQDRSDMPRNADGSQRVPDHVRYRDNVCIDATNHTWSYNTDNAAWTARLADPASGNGASGNRVHGKLAVQWGGKTYTDLSQINALPGGGGNSMLPDAQSAAIRSAYATRDLSQILAAAGIAA